MCSATTWITPDAFCSGPVTATRRAPITTGRYVSNVRCHTIVLAMPVSSSSVMKITPLAVPGRWRTSTRPATVTRAAGGNARQQLVPHDAAPRRDRRAGTTPDAPSARDAGGDSPRPPAAPGGIGGRATSGSSSGIATRREQRQVVLVAGALQRAHRPQRVAPRESERAERVGIREPLQHRGRQARAQPQIAHRVEAAPAHALDALRVRLREKPLIWRKPSRIACVVRMTSFIDGVAHLENAMRCRRRFPACSPSPRNSRRPAAPRRRARARRARSAPAHRSPSAGC